MPIGRVCRSIARRGIRGVRRRLKPHVLILCYHRVAIARGADPWGLCVSPDHFREHVRILSSDADLIHLSQVEDYLRRRPTRPAVALTFDDGYSDNVHCALPILRNWNAPATFFVTTQYLTAAASTFWWDRLAAIVWSARELPRTVELLVRGRRLVWAPDWAGRHDAERLRRELLDTVHAAFWTLEDSECMSAMEQLATRLHVTMAELPDGRCMSASELCVLAQSPLAEIGGHTVTHRHLPSLTPAEQAIEIERSRETLTSIVGRSPTSFAYPYGEFDSTSADAVKKAGFTRACSVAHDLVWPEWDAFQMPRFAVPDMDGESFAARLRWEWLP